VLEGGVSEIKARYLQRLPFAGQHQLGIGLFEAECLIHSFAGQHQLGIGLFEAEGLIHFSNGQEPLDASLQSSQNGGGKAENIDHDTDPARKVVVHDFVGT